MIFTGCLTEQQTSTSNAIAEIVLSEIKLDSPTILPNWTDGQYHDYYGTMKMLNGFNENYPDLVKVVSIGKSVRGKDIWCIKVSNEKNDSRKSSCLIDGCIHGCEWEAGEACLYLIEYLLINFDTNKTIMHILNSSEVYIVPLLNPDGRENDDRFNDNGIDLNRNFDIDFGRIRVGSIPLGKLFDRIKIPYIETPRLHKWFPKVPAFFTNCGRHSFSEPETQALRDLTKQLNDFSFYVTCHTAAHCVIGPWGAFKPPFRMTQHELHIISYVENWIEKNTEYVTYRSGEKMVYQGEEWYCSGDSFDWVFKEYHIPSTAFEILSEEYEMWMGKGKHDHLVHWMQTTLPVFMYLLVNIDNLREWQTPDVQPLLPEGVPPEPLQ